MTIQIRFYGDLRNKIDGTQLTKGGACVVYLDSPKIEYVSDILKEYSINEDEISHIFVNYSYAGLRKKVKDNDRVAIFARNQSLLYKWYFHREEDDE